MILPERRGFSKNQLHERRIGTAIMTGTPGVDEGWRYGRVERGAELPLPPAPEVALPEDQVDAFRLGLLGGGAHQAEPVVGAELNDHGAVEFLERRVPVPRS